VVGHKFLRLVVESLSDIETSDFKALLTYHFLIYLLYIKLKSCLSVCHAVNSPGTVDIVISTT